MKTLKANIITHLNKEMVATSHVLLAFTEDFIPFRHRVIITGQNC